MDRIAARPCSTTRSLIIGSPGFFRLPELNRISAEIHVLEIIILEWLHETRALDPI